MRVLFYVQHLLGIGHLVRAQRIAAAMAARGIRVDAILGGAAGGSADWGAARVIELEPVRAADASFSKLVDGRGEGIGDAFRARRRQQLLGAFEASRPDVLLIESFPFGRRQLEFELLPLIAAAHRRRPRPIVASSIRDILQQGRKPERIADTVRILRRSFDAVLVHGDPAFAALGETFPAAAEIADLVHYTGWVGAAAAAPAGAPFEVVVSAGGGAVGAELFEAALAARPATALAGARWLVLTGPLLAEPAAAALARQAAAGVTVARFRPDLASLLRGARLSISQCGYNTMAEILQARCRAVVVPFAAGGETEQRQRAGKLEALGRAVVVAPSDLTPDTLARAIGRALALPRQPAGASGELDLDGAAGTARVISRLSLRPGLG